MGGIYPSLVGHIIEPLYDIVRGTSRHKYGKVLKKTQWLPREEIERLQVKNLRAIIQYSYETVPFYRKIFMGRDLLPSDIATVEDLMKLPILTKQDINHNFEDLVSNGIPRQDLVQYQSGGSGEPIRFYVTRDKQSWELAAEYRAYEWAGYRLGDRCLQFWGSSIDLSEEHSITKHLAKSVERTILCDAWLLSDEALSGFVEKALRFKPQAIFMFAEYCRTNKIDCLRPKTIITSAEKLLDSRRRIIEEVFDPKIFDHYGSREIGAIASECEEHNGYHISAENVVVEFVRDGEHVAPGENGSIIVTNLRNFGMPFIRYQIGDVGKPSDEKCNCGRGLPMMSSIDGRLSDFLVVYDKELGQVVPYMVGAPGFVGAIFMYVPVDSYRVIQESLVRVRIQMVKGNGYLQKHTDYVENAIRRFLGDNVQVELEFLDSIPPLPSGKRSTFTSKIDSWTGKTQQ